MPSRNIEPIASKGLQSSHPLQRKPVAYSSVGTQVEEDWSSDEDVTEDMPTGVPASASSSQLSSKDAQGLKITANKPKDRAERSVSYQNAQLQTPPKESIRIPPIAPVRVVRSESYQNTQLQTPPRESIPAPIEAVNVNRTDYSPPAPIAVPVQQDAPSGSSSGNQVVAGIIGAIVGVLFAPVLLPAAVGALGFGSGGVVAGSIAASIQSAIAPVVASGASAIAQSIGAGGVTAATGALGGVGGVMAARPNGTEQPERHGDRDGRSAASIDGRHQHAM